MNLTDFVPEDIKTQMVNPNLDLVNNRCCEQLSMCREVLSGAGGYLMKTGDFFVFVICSMLIAFFLGVLMWYLTEKILNRRNTYKRYKSDVRHGGSNRS